MRTNAIDMHDQRFGRLVALEEVGKSNGQLTWRCICDCGKQTVVRGGDLRHGTTKSCGCLSREVSSRKATKHGHARENGGSREYHSWQSMHRRCCRPEHRYWKYYGGRGIKIYPPWHSSNPDGFSNFLSDMGQRPPGKCLDRIDNDDHYSPSNCRWSTPLEQQRNRRGNVHLTAFGETKILSEWADDPRCSVLSGTIARRITAEWTPEDSVSCPSAFIREPSTCPNCGSGFTRVRAWHEFCSTKCRLSAMKI